ncbi:hypothetical protein AN958_07308 [Leucoagaricus sp. SymC.cos]|nr:hypothetical protein AN958_07308 [Leucoagaricus sp. SymC.cos]
MPPNQFIPPGRYSTISSSSSANTGGNLDPSDGHMLQRAGHSSENRSSVYDSNFTQFSVPLSRDDEATITSEPITEFPPAHCATNNSTAPDISFSNQPQNIGPIHYQPVTPVTVRQASATTPSNIWPKSSYLSAQPLQPQQTFPPEAPSIRGDLQQYQASSNTSMWQHHASGLRLTTVKLQPPQMSNEAIASTSQVIPNAQGPRSRRRSPLPPNNPTTYGCDRSASNTPESRKRTRYAMESPAKRQRTSSELATAGVQSGARASTSSDGLLNVPPLPRSTASQDITTSSVFAQSIKMSTQDTLAMSSSQPATLSSWPTAVGSSPVGGRGFQSYIQATGNAQRERIQHVGSEVLRRQERIQHVGSEVLRRLNETGIAQVQNVFEQQKPPWQLETLSDPYSQQYALNWQNNCFTYPPRGANPSQPTQVYRSSATEVDTCHSVSFSSRPSSRAGVHPSLSVDRPRSRHPSPLVYNPTLNPDVNTSNLKLDEQALVNFRSDKGKRRMGEALLDPREQSPLQDASQPISTSQLGFHAPQSSHVLQTSSGTSGAPSKSHANMLGVVPVARSSVAELQVHPQRVVDWKQGSPQASGGGGGGHVSQGTSIVHQDNFPGAHNFVMNNPNIYNTTVQHPQNRPMRAEVLHWLQGYVMKGAEFDSRERDPPPKCHPETRTNILQHAHDWFDNSQREKQLMWLRGPAGVGKSAIVQTLAETLSKSRRLGASIFFSRPNGRSNPQQVFPTLAYRLATLDEAYNAYIGELKHEDPLSLDKSMSEQFRLLFVEPFVQRTLRKGQEDLLVAIDGLDECDGDPVSEYASESLHRGRVAEQVQCEIVRLVNDFAQCHPSVPLVWIIASRPENHLKAVFMASNIKDRYLEEDIPVDSDEACRDVEKFLHTSFTKIQEDYPDIIPHGPWPSNEQFLLIAKAALGLFVFAEVVGYVMKGAEFDSRERDPPPKCHPETRTNILQHAHDWFDNSQREKQLMWLRGPAGVGKSAIVQTLAETLSKSRRLGASIFFSRPNGRSNPQQVFPTLAYRLATLDEAYNAYIGELKHEDPLSLDKSMSEQFRLLFVEPFVQRTLRKGQEDLLVAIDGLDECDGDPVSEYASESLHRGRVAEQVQCEIVRLVNDFAQCHPSVPLVWIIASRPENHLKAVFMASNIKDRYLEEDIPVDSDEACRDVEKFLHTSFTKIQEDYPDIIPHGPWPSNEQFLLIAKAALGLFVFAEVVVRFIGDPAVGNPVSQLSYVLSAVAKLRYNAQRKNPLAVLDAIYAAIMSRLPPDCLDNAKKLLPVLIHLQRHSVNISTIDFKGVYQSLEIVREDAFAALRHLHSVIYFSRVKDLDRTRPRVYHASFHDFLEDPSRSNQYAITRLMKLDAQLALNNCLPKIFSAFPLLSSECLPGYKITDHGYGILGQILENCTLSSGASIDFFSTQCHIPEESLQTILSQLDICYMVWYQPEDIPQAFYEPQLIPVNKLMSRQLLSICTLHSLDISPNKLKSASIEHQDAFKVVGLYSERRYTEDDSKRWLQQSMTELAQKVPWTKVWVWGRKKKRKAALIHTDDLPIWWPSDMKKPIFVVGF